MSSSNVCAGEESKSLTQNVHCLISLKPYISLSLQKYATYNSNLNGTTFFWKILTRIFRRYNQQMKNWKNGGNDQFPAATDTNKQFPTNQENVHQV
jgi:hypothetical protein